MSWRSRLMQGFPYAYIALLALYCLCQELRSPLIALDTDLWHHLNAGRYIFEHQALPDHSFFSFLSPPREWIDYSWLFQAGVYGVYLLSGYHGLIALRTLAFVATLALISCFLFRAFRSRRTALVPALLVALYAALLIPRYQLVRPHLATYLMMTAFLYILEFQPRWKVCLPLLAAAWCNAHGIFYPVLALICGAYLLEYGWDRIRGTRTAHDPSLLAATTLSLAAPFLTPHGRRLLDLSLAPLDYSSRFISELQRLSWTDLLSFHVSGLVPSYPSLLVILIAAAGASLVAAFPRKGVRLGPLILCAGGAYLLTKGVRFIGEFALLALPLLGSTGGATDGEPRAPGPWGGALAWALLPLPAAFLATFFGPVARFPLSRQNLPLGTVAFLSRRSAGGGVLCPPDWGGFLEWELHPRHAIFANMQIPFPFTDEDAYRASHAFMSPRVLGGILAEYNPPFILAPFGRPAFPEIIRKFPDYQPVYFDDVSQLYADRRRFPDLVRSYGCRGIDPLELRRDAAGSGRAGSLEACLRWLLAVDPGAAVANQRAARLYTARGDFRAAIPHAEALIENFPQDAAGYRAKARALEGLALFDGAAASYRQARGRLPDPESRASVDRELGRLHLAQGDYAMAYRLLNQATAVFSPEIPLDDLYQLGLAGAKAGKDREAALVWTYMLRYRVDPGDAAWRLRLNQGLGRLLRSESGQAKLSP